MILFFYMDLFLFYRLLNLFLWDFSEMTIALLGKV